MNLITSHHTQEKWLCNTISKIISDVDINLIKVSRFITDYVPVI